VKHKHDWIRRARIFQVEQYHPPFWPDIDFDAGKLVDAVREHHANVIYFGSAGKWAVFPNPPHSLSWPSACCWRGGGGEDIPG